MSIQALSAPISSLSLLLVQTQAGGKMKGSHSRAADRCPFVLGHSLNQVTSFMQLGMLCFEISYEYIYINQNRSNLWMYIMWWNVCLCMTMVAEALNSSFLGAFIGFPWTFCLKFKHFHILSPTMFLSILNHISTLTLINTTWPLSIRCLWPSREDLSQWEKLLHV